MPFKNIINIVLYQCAWFASVLGAAYQRPWLGFGVAGIVLACHFTQVKSAIPEAKLIAMVSIIGFIFDQTLLSLDLIDYQTYGWSEAFVPAWILALWLTFATLLNVSLRWMRAKLSIAALFGFVGGPLAYYAAQSLGAITINLNAAYWILAIGWAIVMPAFLILARRFDGFYLPMHKTIVT